MSQRIYRPAGNRAVRVKRWGKSPPRQRRRWRHEKPRPVQGKIGDWAARPIATGMSHPFSPGASRRRRADESAARQTERNNDQSAARRRTESGLPAPKLIYLSRAPAAGNVLHDCHAPVAKIAMVAASRSPTCSIRGRVSGGRVLGGPEESGPRLLQGSRRARGGAPGGSVSVRYEE